MRREIHCILVIFTLGSITAQSTNECTTPNREPGVCISIYQCPSLQTTILEHRKQAEYFNLIRASFCGYEGRIAKVCCPLDTSGTESPPVPVHSPPSDGHGQATSAAVLPSATACGKVQVNRDRIVGGNPATLGSWPWIAALGYQSPRREPGDLQWLCGGTLITELHVITAAHCVVFLQGGKKLTVVRLGELDLDAVVDDGAAPIDVPIESSLPHERYNAQILVNDIALLKLKNRVTFTKFIQPICLLRMAEMNNINLAKTMPYVAGWGSTYAQDGYYPPVTTLMEIQVPIVNNTECKNAYAKQSTKNVIDNRVLCAGYAKGGKDSCRGDSGGPLMWPKRNQYFLMGIVSYGTKTCGQPGFPGVYTRVPMFIDWIEDKLRRL